MTITTTLIINEHRIIYLWNQPTPRIFTSIHSATTEMQMYTFLFNKMSTSCFNKCAHKKHKEPDLALGEMSCVDRCVSKYLESQEKVGVILQKANEQQVQQQQRLQEMQQTFGGR